MTESAQQRAKKPVSACVSASGGASSPVCRINEKLANTSFAGFIFVQNCSVDLMMDLTDKSQTMGDRTSAQFPVFVLGAVCIFRSVSAHKPFVLCMVSAETVHEKRSNYAWIPRG